MVYMLHIYDVTVPHACAVTTVYAAAAVCTVLFMYSTQTLNEDHTAAVYTVLFPVLFERLLKLFWGIA